MTNDNRHGTATMAKLFAAQGHWDRAADIYRYLLTREPGREDLAQALAEAETHLSAARSDFPGDLVPLFRQWIDLLLKYEQVGKLRRLGQTLPSNFKGSRGTKHQAPNT
jgi:hypothetical protein